MTTPDPRIQAIVDAYNDLGAVSATYTYEELAQTAINAIDNTYQTPPATGIHALSAAGHATDSER